MASLHYLDGIVKIGLYFDKKLTKISWHILWLTVYIQLSAALQL